MADLPDRFCEICGVIHRPPIHNLATCHPCKYATRFFWKPIDLDGPWPTKDEMRDACAYWDAVFADKGTKPLS